MNRSKKATGSTPAVDDLRGHKGVAGGGDEQF
jgi:hypothetical protein